VPTTTTTNMPTSKNLSFYYQASQKRQLHILKKKKLRNKMAGSIARSSVRDCMLLFFVVALIPQSCHSFLSPCQLYARQGRSNIQSTTLDDEAIQEATPNRENRTKLTFVANFTADSSSVPAASPEKVLEYFQNPKHLSFGASMPSSQVDSTPELVDQWTRACHAMGANPPNLEKDMIISVRTGGISIPGLAVEWSAYIGAKLILQSDTRLPAFEFVLIKDESSARGVRPLLWIYEKVMGGKSGGGAGSKSTSRETSFFSRIAMKPTQEEGDFIFNCNGFMEIKCEVPNVVLKATRGNKEKSEARMSKLIGNQIEKDMEKAMNYWQETYTQWGTVNF
jgi:hypothetical protein